MCSDANNWSAPVPGRSKLETAGPFKIVEDFRHADIAAAEDGRAPNFENARKHSPRRRQPIQLAP
jgi:hypothetical protein